MIFFNSQTKSKQLEHSLKMTFYTDLTNLIFQNKKKFEGKKLKINLREKEKRKRSGKLSNERRNILLRITEYNFW